MAVCAQCALRSARAAVLSLPLLPLKERVIILIAVLLYYRASQINRASELSINTEQAAHPEGEWPLLKPLTRAGR